jgi:hemolysin activation/secretion protein
LALAYPLVRSSERNIWLSLTGSYKKLRDEIEIADYVEKRKIWSMSFEVKHEAWHQVGGKVIFTELTGRVTGGRLSYDDAEQAEANREGVDTVGNFAYVNLGLKSSLNISENWSLEGSAMFQKSLAHNLDSAEQFSVTGSGGVKAYREIISGDNGYLLNAHLRYRLPEPMEGFNHFLGLFVDHGGWRYEDKGWLPAGEKSSDTMTDIGLSYSIYFQPLVLNVQAARALGSWPDGLRKEGRTHVLVNLGVFF